MPALPAPQTGADEAKLNAFLNGKTSSVTYQGYIGGPSPTITVTLTRP